MVKTRDQATSGSSTDGLPAARAEPSGILGRLGRVVPRPFVVSRAPATPANGNSPAPARPRGEMGRFFTGMMAYVIGSFLLQYLLLLANSYFKLNLNATQTLFPRNTPLIGSMTSFAIIYLLLLIALIWALYRFNIMPRDLLGARRAAQRAAQSAATPTGTRSRSRRRRGTGTTTSTAGTGAAHTASTTRRANASLRPPLTRASEDGTSDAHYERVKALQRGRRRKR